RALEAMRAHLRAAARGLPRRADLLALPRQRFDEAERRLGRALLANTGAHGLRLARCATRLSARLLATRVAQLHDRVDTLGRRADASLGRLTGPRRARLERIGGRLRPRPLRNRILQCRERLDALDRRARGCLAAKVAGSRNHLEGCGKLLASLSYHAVLARGFALVRDAEGRTVRAAAGVVSGQRLDIELADGHIDAEARGAGRARGAATPGAKRPAQRTTTGSRSGNQGSLF
ncbi:MAG TPA: exodeoxyribonuclease VII large subunit, partial [Hyphomicrobiaceae bacterium]|nr:exodeoxyribonuclease VII large subunit [Hyphomicrobiaceae bacterium]